MLNDKLLLDLRNWFETYPSKIIAFSGGIDSIPVLFLSRKFLGKDRTIGVTCLSSRIP